VRMHIIRVWQSGIVNMTSQKRKTLCSRVAQTDSRCTHGVALSWACCRDVYDFSLQNFGRSLTFPTAINSRLARSDVMVQLGCHSKGAQA
jgi:hypothetical protein